MAYIGCSGWNTLNVGGLIPDEEVLEAVDASYATVAKLVTIQVLGVSFVTVGAAGSTLDTCLLRR